MRRVLGADAERRVLKADTIRRMLEQRAPRGLKAATAKHAEATEPPKRLTPAQKAPASSTRTARAEGGDGKARRGHRAAEATHAASTESASIKHAHRAS